MINLVEVRFLLRKKIIMKNSGTLCDTSTATAAIIATSDTLQGCWIIYCTSLFIFFMFILAVFNISLILFNFSIIFKKKIRKRSRGRYT